ncbi:MAG TPA: hypothetical protein VFP94_07590, partial [Terriglobales bacterium]|nr:hypothetical protein [Terriglobales bacterium]
MNPVNRLGGWLLGLALAAAAQVPAPRLARLPAAAALARGPAAAARAARDAGMAAATGFRQRAPTDGAAATAPTTVYFGRTGQALVVVWVCSLGPSDGVRAHLGPRARLDPS